MDKIHPSKVIVKKSCVNHNYINISTKKDINVGTVRFKCSVCGYFYRRKELKGENYSGQNSSR